MNEALLKEAAKKFGTPLYVLDEGELARRIACLRKRLPKAVHMVFAMKANPFVTAAMAELADGIECCSPGELAICQALGVPAQKVVLSGVHKDRAMVESFLEWADGQGLVTIESEAQAELVTKAAEKTGGRVRVLLRLSSGNQFGMDAEACRRVAARLAGGPVEVAGLQYFSGTQKGSAKRMARELDRLRALAEEFEAAGTHVARLEYGPGLPVDYYGEKAPGWEDELLAGLTEALEPLCSCFEVALEAGRSLTATCGTYLTSVVDAKVTDGEAYAILDGGKHQLSYYGGGMLLKNPPCRVLAPAKAAPGDAGTAPGVWTLCGSLCTVNDVLAKRAELAGIAPGAIVAFDLAGAYSATEGIALFLSRDLPAVAVAAPNGALALARDHLAVWPLNTHGKEGV